MDQIFESNGRYDTANENLDSSDLIVSLGEQKLGFLGAGNQY